jgi:hypothetical protein
MNGIISTDESNNSIAWDATPVSSMPRPASRRSPQPAAGLSHERRSKIVGFGRASEWVAVEIDVSDSVLDRVKLIAGVPSSDPELLGSYPLDARQLAMIADEVHMSVDPVRFQYFLEAYDAPDERREAPRGS